MKKCCPSAKWTGASLVTIITFFVENNNYYTWRIPYRYIYVANIKVYIKVHIVLHQFITQLCNIQSLSRQHLVYTMYYRDGHGIILYLVLSLSPSAQPQPGKESSFPIDSNTKLSLCLRHSVPRQQLPTWFQVLSVSLGTFMHIV